MSNCGAARSAHQCATKKKASPATLTFQRRWLAALTRVVPGPGGIERSDLCAGSVRISRFRKPLAGAVGVVDPADRCVRPAASPSLW